MAKLVPCNQYVIERRWFQQGDKYSPLIAIRFKEKRWHHDRWDHQRWYRILEGEYLTSAAAQEAAEKAQIEGVYDYGSDSGGIIRMMSAES